MLIGLSDLGCSLWSDSGNLLIRCRLSLGHRAVFERPHITASDSLQFCGTLLLVLAAFLAPYAVWLRRRKYLAPKLEAFYDHREPMARLSSRSVGGQPTGEKVFDFHFLVRNVGRTAARNVVAEIVEFWYVGSSGSLVKLEEFLPVYLRYHETEYVDIHPQRPYYWNIGSIPSRNMQNSWIKDSLYDAPGTMGRGLRFALDLHKPPHNQPNVLLRGRYGLGIILYSENASPVEVNLEIDWSGRWRATAEYMLKEITVTKVSSFS